MPLITGVIKYRFYCIYLYFTTPVINSILYYTVYQDKLPTNKKSTVVYSILG